MSSFSSAPIALDNSVLLLSADPYRELSESEQQRLSKYLRVRRSHDGWTIAKRQRYAGLVQAGPTTYWLEPPFSPAAFIYLLLRHRGIRDAADRAHALASNRNNRSLDDLMQVMSLMMLEEAERLAAGHIAQSYIRREERLSVVRGRPLWHMQAGRPPDGQVNCRFEEKSTNSLQNRLVLAGLDAASNWLTQHVEASALRTQRFIWRSLAETYQPAPHDFEIAEVQLNRMTAGYRTALSIARALLFGFDLNAVDPNIEVAAPIFDLAALFETLVELVGTMALAGTGLVVERQASERRAILTRSNETYRTIRPDIIIWRDGVPLLVVDSKFKPQYADGGPVPPSGNRMTREDIFQTFFYAHRVAHRAGLNHPIAAAIAAPQLEGAVPPDDSHRHVRWGEEDDRSGTRLTLLLVPVDGAVRALIQGDSDYCRHILRPAGLDI